MMQILSCHCQASQTEAVLCSCRNQVSCNICQMKHPDDITRSEHRGTALGYKLYLVLQGLLHITEAAHVSEVTLL